MVKNYYAILGVTPQAEDVVIRAAYRALAQRYHPDKHPEGASVEAERKMAEINEAYSVLSDPERRKAYDTECETANMDDGSFDSGDEAADEGRLLVDRDWRVALDYYPDLADLEALLSKTSKRLAFTFRLFMIIEKAFSDRHQVAREMHDEFLRNYFGDQPAILDFAKTLILSGQRDAARALNEAARVLGPSLDPALVIHKIKGRFGIAEQFRTNFEQKSNSSRTRTEEGRSPDAFFGGAVNSRAARLSALAARSNSTTDDFRNAIDALGGVVEMENDGCTVDVFGQVYNFKTRFEAVSWFRSFIYPKLYFSD